MLTLETDELNSIKQKFGIVGSNPELNLAISKAIQIAKTDLPVLITGESGVGKENFPKMIHQYSLRKHQKYIAVNCGAIPEGTIDSELFGHVKGSFTGALTDRVGYFEAADGGTIFLDEVGELPYPTQARLLRVLQNGEYYRVGSSDIRKTNVRVVAATNLDMEEAIRAGRFREDLYYRLNAIPIALPPLRNRKEDILPLFYKFAGDFAETYRRPAIRLDQEAEKMLRNYYWQGNIRQLKNVAEQISAVETDGTITAEVLAGYLPDAGITKLPQTFKGNASSRSFNNEREILYQVLFDMKKDMNEMKQVVSRLAARSGEKYPADGSERRQLESAELNYVPYERDGKAEEYQEAQEVEDNRPLAVDEMEKELIRKALEKHEGKRKYAAMDLKISERTLYRKIKEYGLEDL